MKRKFCYVLMLSLLSLSLFGNQWIVDGPEGKVFLNIDENEDSIPDCIISYDEDGNKIYQELDFNVDGKMDDFYFYEEGRLVKHEIDTNYDGKIDIWVYLKEGVYVEKYHQDLNFDGEIDIKKEYGI